MMEGKLVVGDVEITAFTDAEGPFPLKLSQLFPEVRPEQWLPFRHEFPASFVDPDTWHAHFGSYVIRDHNRVMLVDTGLGPSPDPFLGQLPGNLVGRLAAAGIRPVDIDTVIITHLHFDHVGWNLTDDAKPTFPNARYVVHQADWDAFQTPQVQAAFPFQFVDQMITPLKELGVLQLVSEQTELSNAVKVLPAPGHTPGHICVIISDGGQKALILGDAIIHPAMVSEPEWKFAFDMDPEVAIATRKRLIERIELESMTAIQCHCPPPGFGLIVRRDGRRHWQPMEQT